MAVLSPYEVAAKWVDLFRERTSDIMPQHSGILPSEMLLFVSQCLERGVPHVIESGRLRGYSTEVLAKFKDFWHVTSIEKRPDRPTDQRLAARYKHVMLLCGDGVRLVRDSLTSHPRSGILLDGPKGLAGLKLFWNIRRNATVVGIHDLYPQGTLDDDMRMILAICGVRVAGGNLARILANQIPGAYFSDALVFVREFGDLDATTLTHIGHTHKTLLPCSSVLGMFDGRVR